MAIYLRAGKIAEDDAQVTYRYGTDYEAAGGTATIQKLPSDVLKTEQTLRTQHQDTKSREIFRKQFVIRLRGGAFMSTREIAYSILDSLSEEKLEAFITLFADEETVARFESEMIKRSEHPKLYHSFAEYMAETEQENA